jgi:phage shock protein PspC (stress-responsive transcriptional regulator)
MIRSIAIAATLGALVAGVAAYAIYPSMRPSEPTPAEQAAAAPTTGRSVP